MTEGLLDWQFGVIVTRWSWSVQINHIAM